MPATGGELESFTEEAALWAAWPRDRDEFYFTSVEERTRLWEVNGEGLECACDCRPQRQKGSIGVYALAADEAYVYFVWDEAIGDLWVVDVVADDTE